LESYRVNSEPQFGRDPRPSELPVTDKVLQAFRDFVKRDAEAGLSQAQIERDLDYVRLRIRENLVNAAYGGDAATRFLLDSDPQMLRALELFPEAKSLAVSMLLAFALAALTLTGRIEEWHIFVLAAMLGIVNAFNIPAQSAFVIDMVGRDDLVNAIALNSSMVNGARIAGPAVAGILVA